MELHLTQAQIIRIQTFARRCSMDTTDLSSNNVRKMFKAAAKELIIPGERNQRVDQLKWQTMVSRVRKKLKEAKEALAADAG